MSHQKCELFNYMAIPLILVDLALFLVNFNEVYVLFLYTVIIGCAHVDYGVAVVRRFTAGDGCIQRLSFGKRKL